MYVRSSLIIGLALLGVICLPSAQSGDESTKEELPLSEIKQLIQQNVSSGIANFTVNLNRILSSAKKNIIFSPVNIYNAMALVFAGADGDTEDELAEVLGLPIPSEAPNLTNVTHDVIGNVLKSVQASKTVTVNVAAGIFVKNGLQQKAEYKEQLTTIYATEFTNVDFANSSTTELINNWVSNKTNGRIPKLFASPIAGDTELLLTTVLYFCGGWKHTFVERYTEIANFTVSESEILSVKMMSNLKTVPYYDNTPRGYQAMGLHYVGAEYTMFFILPTNDRTPQTLNFTAADIHSIVNASLENTTFVDYKVPKTKFSWNEDISNSIKELGAQRIFTNPDFSRMVEGNSLKVSRVHHAAEIEIDEYGTVASAATGVTFTRKANFMPWGETPKFVLDKPFSMFIYHHNTSSVLFYGNVYNPNGN